MGQCKMLLFCTKVIMNESHNFELGNPVSFQEGNTLTINIYMYIIESVLHF